MNTQTQTMRMFFFPGFLYENSTGDVRFAFTGLTPYTNYTIVIQARAAGELGPGARKEVITLAEGEATFKLMYCFAFRLVPINDELTSLIEQVITGQKC